MRRLTIISHTEHYLAADGTVVGLGATVTEIRQLLALFDQITHIAMLHAMAAPPHAIPYQSDQITFVPIPALGGAHLSDKLAILKNAPKIISIINKHLKTSDYFQFRAPTGIGVFVIPYLMLLHKQKGWFKYAGNWKQEQAPFAYRFQKWLLEHQSRSVTINGFWDSQPKHCLSFENPCLTQEEVQEGQLCIAQKKFETPLEFCFVGRLESAKGLDILVETFATLNASERSKIGTIHIVGESERKAYYERKITTVDLDFVFHGLLSRQAVQAIYKRSHAIILPSTSEGFPKVIAEALNFGCIPIVSDISSVGHYIIDGTNGLLLKTITVDGLKECLDTFFALNREQYDKMMHSNRELMPLFTYDYYNQRLKEVII